MSTTARFDRIRPLLVCPACRGELIFAADAARCAPCAAEYSLRGGKIYFIEPPARTDTMDSLKGRLKALLGDSYYSIGVNVLAPEFPFRYHREVLLSVDPATKVVVDAGSGNRRHHQDFICCDCFDYDEVDVVCALEALPFRDGSVDFLMSIYALEHVRELRRVVAQFDRCTRAGGMGMHVFPFLYPYHASPGDYWRYTHEGLPALFPGWEVVRRINTGGPFTLAMALFVEFFATLFSFGSSHLKAVLYLLGCGLSFPIKYLDVFFVRREAFLALAPTILVSLRKPEDAATSARRH